MILEVCFAAVLLDCHGGPETVARYLVRAGTVRICSWGTDPESGTPLPIYCGDPSDRASALTERPSRPQPSPPGEVCISEDVPAPGVGEVAMIRITTQDEAGNLDDDPCL